ncbi:TNF receptor-associated factor 2-like isoform X2 [Ptychodera flava]|uniref:TNF receptor-associated factor 2-like isoform X2 n=1 Tax=Ptychodera flava TaxID=63121 RepID=UPI003969ECEA
MAGSLSDEADSRLRSKYKCNECRNILRTPVQTECGHRFCNLCFETAISNEEQPRCKGCLDEDSTNTILSKNESFSDRAILRELRNISVQCQNAKCQWSGNYIEYDEIHADSCPFHKISCTNKGCGEIICRIDLDEHLTDRCGMRKVPCQYCETNLKHTEMKTHLEVCSKYPITCKYCNRPAIARAEMTRHIDAENGDCEKRLVPCKYKDLGCNHMVEIDQTQKHDSKNATEHLSCLLLAVTRLSETAEDIHDQRRCDDLKVAIAKHERQLSGLVQAIETLQADIKKEKEDIKARQSMVANSSQFSVSGNVQQYEKVTEKLKNTLTILETKLVTYEGVLSVLKNQLEQNLTALRNLESGRRQDRELIESLERKIKAQDRIIAMKDIALAEQDLRIQSLELASYDGSHVWKISDFSRKRRDALSGRNVSFYSPCFYTSYHGYKMCARVYLNGDGMGKGNHVSLFFVVMRGEYDALLRWPFRQKVTFTWIDQNNREHVVDAFRPDPTSSSFRRPVNDMNIASGCPLFMPLSLLDSPRHAYVKDDIAFLKISVDTTDIA